MFISQFSYFTSARGTLQKALLDQERLVHFLYRPRILADGRRDRTQPDRTAAELVDDRAQNLVDRKSTRLNSSHT